ncbi:DUF2007 domain-containing protein [Pseudovibrio sp. Tun.PSC04-5.I4]|uniref:putative signal transducing protein n=1 Tax=Pseudovibrio sp. Tun.PSC04-5.I4 TaxID=1798213 RepID=UPI0008870A3A|nr:DUF2007 domain-containing protein [Pseudovibrio sp. Tun.PSC04-5.I4]SDR37729.1 Putative signal transducing protein [Pseudovibrio sp. Tun.PSC04-5.I4]
MEELVRTTDPVLISHVEALMGETDIIYFVADTNMSILDGSLGFLPRRIMVETDRIKEARDLMKSAGLEDYLKEV